MSSGKITLVSTGQQDSFLTGSPQLSFFLKQYAQHTPFSIETLDTTFDNDGSTELYCTVPRKGDLIKTMYLRIDLPNSDGNNNSYPGSIGNMLVEFCDLIIGGQTIQRINGEYMFMYSECFMTDSQRYAMTQLCGESTSDPTASQQYPADRTLIVPLPFYFYREPPLAIPLVALQRHEVQVRLKLRTLYDALGQPIVPSHVSLPVEYVYLGATERQHVISNYIDYRITQLQMHETFVPAGTPSPVSIDLPFINPVKELFVVIQDEDRNNTTSFLSVDDNQNPVPQLQNLRLDFNGETMIDPLVATDQFLGVVTFMTSHSRVPDAPCRFYNYSFALQPEYAGPTGQVNMSRIRNKNLYVNLNPGAASKDRRIRVYARSFNILRVMHAMAGVLFTDNNFF